MAELQLHVLLASTRPGRAGDKVAAWFLEHARAHDAFTTTLVDLAEVDLPFLDEPNHPSMRQYVHEHTKRWSRIVDAADAYVIVTPEYNNGITAPLKNALDCVFHEWADKPVAFVSYGGVAAGTRAVQMAKQVALALRMHPIPDGVHLVLADVLRDGVVDPGPAADTAAAALLARLADSAATWAEHRRRLAVVG
jgi:NAD(P)H-dependent FMN reductase